MIKRKPLSLKLPPGQIAEIDRIREMMPAKPTFTAVVEAALALWIERAKKEARVRNADVR